jgi:hypothetical protein
MPPELTSVQLWLVWVLQAPKLFPIAFSSTTPAGFGVLPSGRVPSPATV